MYQPARLQQIAAASQQRRGASTDADVAVDQQDVSPGARLREIAEN
jgi:hypothetical protein